MKLTPAMEQFMKVKNEHPDCTLLFRMGDFYETFFDDAKVVSRDLNIVLTSRGKDKVPLAGIPYHSIDPYINKLISKGHKVAIVEQLEDPKKAKGLVKRGLVKIITPGTVLDDNVLDENKNNFLVSVSNNKDDFGVASIDLSTGDFMVTEVKDLISELKRINPSEIIVQGLYANTQWVKDLKTTFFVNPYSDVFYYHQNAKENLLRHFNTVSLKGFGLESELVISAAGSIISYLKETQMTEIKNISTIKCYSSSQHLILDPMTIRNLELFTNVFDNTKSGSLIEAIDKTSTPMGSRKLRSWILRPLIEENKINERYDAVEELSTNGIEVDELKKLMEGCLDIQRLISRITNNVNCPKDLIGLKKSLELIPNIKQLLSSKSSFVNNLFEVELKDIAELIEKSIPDESPSHIRDGNIIKMGYSEELDEIKRISKSAKKYILDLEKQEKERTGIKSLKIKYNKIFGYFIEVTKSNLANVPDEYIRKQTQVNSERYITQELKEKEDMILNSREKQIELEQKLYFEIVSSIVSRSADILKTADELSVLDVITSFCELAIRKSYNRPKINNQYDLIIKDGRHPVIETLEDDYIPNDIALLDKNKMMIITGPNMSGKSSYMRQNALIIILAHIGCFVPAKEATIGIVDRIFTRIGALDDISSGQSTFMVEMNETANIINSATCKSFIILDEIGRGTSTYDGMSLAWAISEYIIKNIGAKTMFATHYHQLNRLSQYYSQIKNFHIKVLEDKDRIIFLHKIEMGGTDRSYGIEVAKLAGLPKELIENAKKAMYQFEIEDEVSEKLYKPMKGKMINGNVKKSLDDKIKQLKLDQYG